MLCQIRTYRSTAICTVRSSAPPTVLADECAHAVREATILRRPRTWSCVAPAHHRATARGPKCELPGNALCHRGSCGAQVSCHEAQPSFVVSSMVAGWVNRVARVFPSDVSKLALAGASHPELATLVLLRKGLSDDFTVFHGVHWSREYAKWTRQLHKVAPHLAYPDHPASSSRAANPESFSVCATPRNASVPRVRLPHPCEANTHAPMYSKSPTLKGRASSITRDLCNIRVDPLRRGGFRRRQPQR